MNETRGKRPSMDILWHFALIVFVGGYFGVLLLWFGSMFARGGSEEHAVLGVVLPIVLLLGTMAVVGFTIIALEGRRSETKKSERSSD